MASDFLGRWVHATFNYGTGPPIRGIIHAINGSTLSLANVTRVDTGQFIGALDLDPTRLASLDVLPNPGVAPSPAGSQPFAAPQPHFQPTYPPYEQHLQRTPTEGPPSRPESHVQIPQQLPVQIQSGPSPNDDEPDSVTSIAKRFQPPPIPRSLLEEAVRTSPSHATPTIPARYSDVVEASPLKSKKAKPRSGLATSVVASLSELSVGDVDGTSTLPEVVELGTGEANGDVNGTVRAKDRSKRRTKANAPTMSREPSTITTPAKKSRTRQRNARHQHDESGWATEEASEVQELGDFDFAENLSKFNKTEIFHQMREEDTIAQSDRLVGHNRLIKPGTAGGRNLHWTENVLESPSQTDFGASNIWNSEADDTETDGNNILGEIIPSSGRSSRLNARLSQRKVASRQTSGRGSELSATPLAQLIIKPASRQTSFDRAVSPMRRSTLVPSPARSRSRHSTNRRGSKKPRSHTDGILCVTPLQMLELEQHVVTEQGLSEDVLAENAGRGIAEIVLRTATDRQLTFTFAIGNHRTGARALAAARHLLPRCSGVNVAIVDPSNRDGLLESVQQQIIAFEKQGGRILKLSTLVEQLKTGRAKPSTIIDGILGIHTTWDDLGRGSSTTCYELRMLCESMGIPILSIDVPSGIDPVTGASTTLDSQPFTFRPQYIVFIAAPKPWYLNIVEQEGQPRAFVVDVGFGSKIWSKFNRGRQQPVDFGSGWTAEL